ncbi:MAG: AI-2E family transporter, partial [Devosiaceae bacterium]|nr:AI-2E family transporter [Devosiaceae bacterium]
LVPSHDRRDFEFAKKYKIGMKNVIESKIYPFEGEGSLINSGEFNDMHSKDAQKAILKKGREEGWAEKESTYKLRDWVFNLIPPAHQPDMRGIYQEVKQIWQGYLRGNLALMLITGVLFTLAWLAIGLPGALILGIITGVLTIIPDLGPAIAAALAAIVALFEGSTYLNITNLWFAVLVIGIYMLLINIKGIWIRPRIFARSVHMHDGIVFIAIMAAVVLQGILGALVIVPVLASAGILGRYVYRQLMVKSPPHLNK